MNDQPLTIEQAAILTEHSEVEVSEAVRDLRWPSFVDESGQTFIDPVVVVHHWARDLTDPRTRTRTRALLSNLAEAADYPLDIDAFEQHAERHLKIDKELKAQRACKSTADSDQHVRERWVERPNTDS